MYIRFILNVFLLLTFCSSYCVNWERYISICSILLNICSTFIYSRHKPSVYLNEDKHNVGSSYIERTHA